MDLRKKNFKKGVDADETRRRREDETVQIRKQKRDEQLAKKRLFNPEEDCENSENVPPTVKSNVPEAGAKSIVAQLMQTQDPDARLSLTSDLRRLVAKSKNPPIQEAVDAGAVAAMVPFLSSEDPKLQFEAAWVLTNIASGDTHQTQAVVDGGAIPPFCSILANGDPQAQEQVVWALGNIAGDSITNRDGILSLGAITPMLNLLVKNQDRVAMLQNVTWVISNLCRGKPQPDISYIAPALPYLERLLHVQDHDTLSDALWCFSYLADGPAVQAVIETGAVAQMVKLLDTQKQGIIEPALRACGNIATGTDLQTMVLLQSGVLGPLQKVLQSAKKQHKKEALWLISNVTAGTQDQLQMVIDSGLMEVVVASSYDSTQEVRKEALWALSNAAMGANPVQKESMTKMGAVQAIAESLGKHHDVNTVKCALDALTEYLKAGEQRKDAEGGDNIYCGILEEAGALERLEELQDDQNEAVYNKAVHILATYFSCEEDAETQPEEVTTTAIQPQFAFNFGA